MVFLASGDFGPMQQLRSPKTAELIAARIRKAIIRGQLKDGDNLPPEARLIEDFGVSRPTIREAIRILEAEQLIEVSRGSRGGARVRPPTADIVARPAGLALQFYGATLGDLYEARITIEPPAARMAAKRRPRETAAALRAHIATEWETIEDIPAANFLTARFHMLLMEQSGNITLALLAAALQSIVEKHQALVHRAQSQMMLAEQDKRMRRGLRSQERLAALIEAGDAQGAEAHWIRHMKAAGEFWLGQFSETAVVDVLD